MISIAGTIVAKAEVRTHSTPDSNGHVGEFVSGANFSDAYGPYHNTGNVDQTLTATVANTVNITVSDVEVMYTAPDGTQQVGTSLVIPAGASAFIRVTGVLAENPVGHAPETFGFDIEDVWS